MPMSVGKTVVRNVNAKITATEEGIAVLLDIATNVDAYTILAESYNKIKIYRCNPVSNGKYRCELIKDWGVWENYQRLTFFTCDPPLIERGFTMCAALHIVIPNNIVNRLVPLISGYVLGIKVITKLDGYVLYSNKTWNEIHARLKKRVLVTEKTVKKGHG